MYSESRVDALSMRIRHYIVYLLKVCCEGYLKCKSYLIIISMYNKNPK